MTYWLRKQHNHRCEYKRAYKKAAWADEAARRASHKTGELIISYECVDCGWWHIGHADATQVALHDAILSRTCVMCGRRISRLRLESARRSGSTTETCSARCHHKLRRQRSEERKRLTRQRSPPEDPAR